MKLYNYNGKMNLVGIRVRQARNNLHLFQSDLAAKMQVEGVNIEQKAISRIELQERIVTDFELLKLALILKVSVQWLLTGDDK